MRRIWEVPLVWILVTPIGLGLTACFLSAFRGFCCCTAILPSITILYKFVVADVYVLVLK